MKAWMIPTHNDPLGAVRGVLQILWQSTKLESILLPLNDNVDVISPNIIENQEQIQKFNPFTPIMPINAAQMVPDLVNRAGQVAAVLRPCELRTLRGMLSREKLNIENMITISVDCLGTLPTDEFQWRTQRKRSPKGLTQETLQFARQGGIVRYRYRSACQICESPNATGADINICVLGLPVRQYIFISVEKDNLANLLYQNDAMSVDSQLLSQHQRVISRLAERGNQTRQRIFSDLVGVLPSDIKSLMEPIHGCNACRACMDNCPICANDYPQQDDTGEYRLDDVIEWLVSCSECGICEQYCPKNLPLTIIFGYIRDLMLENRI